MVPQCISIRASASRCLQSPSAKSKWPIRRWPCRTNGTKTSVCTRRFIPQVRDTMFLQRVPLYRALGWLSPSPSFGALGRVGRCRAVESSFFRNRKLCGRSVLRMEVLRDRCRIVFSSSGVQEISLKSWDRSECTNIPTELVPWFLSIGFLGAVLGIVWVLFGAFLERCCGGALWREREMRRALCALHNTLPLAQNQHVNPKHGHGRCALCMCVSCRCGM